MAESFSPTEPNRPADIARLALTKLRIEDGIALETVFQRVTETAADILNVERIGVWLLVDERRALRCVTSSSGRRQPIRLASPCKCVHSPSTSLPSSDARRSRPRSR